MDWKVKDPHSEHWDLARQVAELLAIPVEDEEKNLHLPSEAGKIETCAEAVAAGGSAAVPAVAAAVIAAVAAAVVAAAAIVAVAVAAAIVAAAALTAAAAVAVAVAAAA